MAQTYTLEEAAQRLGIPPEEMKRRLKEDWKTLRSFRDGPTLRFRAADVEELARSLGAASDPGLPLAAEGSGGPGSDDFKVHSGADEPLVFGGEGSTDEDIFSLSADDSKSGSKKDKKDSDSDVRLESAKAKGKEKDKGKGKDKDAEVVPTEEIALDLSGPGSAVIKGGSSAKLSAPKSSSSKLSSSSSDAHKKISDLSSSSSDSSEFELSLDSDSSDFELQLNTDSSDEVDLGTMPKEKSGKPRAGGSGINLRDPADSGINLENKKKGDSGKKLKGDTGKNKAAKPADPTDDSDDFELSLEPAGASGGKSSGKSKPPVTSDSDSEFELTLDDSGSGSSLEAAALESADADKNDIFETDFDIPPMSEDSGSEAVALESDTDLENSPEVELALDDSDLVAEEETGSQVVLLEDEGTAEGEVDLVDVDEDDESVSSVMRKQKKTKSDDEEEDDAPATVTVAAAPAKWGPLPAIVLAFAFIPIFFGSLIGFELLHTMWGYQQPRKPAAPVVRWAATQLDMELRDQ